MPGAREDEPVVQSVTTAPKSHRDDSAERIHRYLITMAIRTVCFVAAILLRQWPVLCGIAVLGAVVLPYVAVVLANARMPHQLQQLQPVTSPRQHRLHLPHRRHGTHEG